MNKLFGVLIVGLLLSIGGIIYYDYNSQFTNLLCNKIHLCNLSITTGRIEQSSISSGETNKYDSTIIPINGYKFIEKDIFQKITENSIEKEVDTYGKIIGSEISYSGKQVAIIQGDRMRYKSISIILPSDMIGRNHRFFISSGSIKSELFWVIDKVGLIQGAYNTDKSMIFIINNNTQNIDIKEFCDDKNLPGAGNRVADSISKEIITENGIDIYKIYRTYNEPQLESNGEICTIRNNILYKIFVYNYNKERTKAILNSFQFIN